MFPPCPPPPPLPSPNSPPPPPSPSCAAPAGRRRWWRRPRHSASPASASPTATRWPAWCARMRRRRRPGCRLLVGSRLVFRDATPDLIAYPDGPRRLGPADHAAHHSASAARRRASAISTAPTCSTMAAGQVLLALPPRAPATRVRRDLAPICARALGDRALSRRLPPASTRTTRGGCAALALDRPTALRRRQRGAVSRRPSAAAAGRDDLHPRSAPPSTQAGLALLPNAERHLKSARRDGAAVPRPSATRSPARWRSWNAAASRSTISPMNIPTSRCRRAARRMRIWPR